MPHNPELDAQGYFKIMNREYIFIREGVEEKVTLERWAWGAIMKDGTELHQFDDNGSFHQVGEIDQANLKMFCLRNTADSSKRIDMPFSADMKLIYKYRNIKLWYKEEWTKVYVAGFKKGNQHSFIYILPDDRIIFSDSDTVNLDLFGIK